MILYAAPIFLGAFLLFLVQPSSPSRSCRVRRFRRGVGHCMVFSRCAVLGYAYPTGPRAAHAPRQVVLHVALLALSCCCADHSRRAWKPAGNEEPAWRILGLLAVTIGLPYFLLSTTAADAGVVRVAFSSCGAVPAVRAVESGSLLALLFYPVAIERGSRPRRNRFRGRSSMECSRCSASRRQSERPQCRRRQGGCARGGGRTRCRCREAGRPQQLVWLTLAAMASFLRSR